MAYAQMHMRAHISYAACVYHVSCVCVRARARVSVCAPVCVSVSVCVESLVVYVYLMALIHNLYTAHASINRQQMHGLSAACV